MIKIYYKTIKLPKSKKAKMTENNASLPTRITVINKISVNTKPKNFH